MWIHAIPQGKLRGSFAIFLSEIIRDRRVVLGSMGESLKRRQESFTDIV